MVDTFGVLLNYFLDSGPSISLNEVFPTIQNFAITSKVSVSKEYHYHTLYTILITMADLQASLDSCPWCDLESQVLCTQTCPSNFSMLPQRGLNWVIFIYLFIFFIRMYFVLPESNLLQSDALCCSDLEMSGEENMCLMISFQFSPWVGRKHSV